MMGGGGGGGGGGYTFMIMTIKKSCISCVLVHCTAGKA